MSSDNIFIRDLTVELIVGVLPHERTTMQPVLFDLELYNDIRPAAASDDLSDALDYASLTDKLVGYLQSTNFELIETLAEAVAQWLLTEFAISRVKLRLTKPNALPGQTNVGVCIERGD